MRFGTLIADPPWAYDNSPGQGSAADRYQTQATEWICSLPVAAIAERDSVLLLWATNPKLQDAFRVIEAWGFEYKTKLTWVKMSRAAAPRIGLGFHARACTEELLIATKGSPGVPRNGKPCGVIFNPIGAHSRKPDAQYEIAEGYAGPYLELFHRPRDGMFPPRPGWMFAGYEVDGLDMREALERLYAGKRSV